VTTPTWSTLGIATTLAIRTAASRLAGEFTCTFGPKPSNDSFTPPTTSLHSRRRSASSSH
jgi:hypothetical protein